MGAIKIFFAWLIETEEVKASALFFVITLSVVSNWCFSVACYFHSKTAIKGVSGEITHFLKNKIIYYDS